jgi:hypothetical protein
MKKIFVILTAVLFLSLIPAGSGVILEKNNDLNDNKEIINNDLEEWDGNFSAVIGYPNKEDDPTVVAGMIGVFKLRRQGGIFAGKIYNTDREEIGTLRGFFGRNIFVGRIIGESRNLPIVGFISIKPEKQQFIGRGMSTFGPALYFVGRYEEF